MVWPFPSGPPLEISPVSETSQLGRHTCAEDPYHSTKEREKHNVAWASDNAVQAAANTHTHTQIQQPRISNNDLNQVPSTHTHSYLSDTHTHHSKEIKVSPPSLDRKIAACDHHGNHAPPQLEISPASEISQLGRHTCAEDPCNCTKELEKHNAALSSDYAVQAAAHTWDNPTLEILLSWQLSQTPRPGLETHPLPGLEPSQAGVAPPFMGRNGGLFPSQCVTQVVPNTEKSSHMAIETVQVLFSFAETPVVPRTQPRQGKDKFCYAIAQAARDAPSVWDD